MAPPRGEGSGGKSRVPRDQWRARSKKSAVQRLHRQKGRNLAANLEKVENMLYQRERQERDRERREQGQAPAGHHNLPSDVFVAKPKEPKSKAAKKQNVASKFPANSLLGLLRPEVVRKRLQEIFAVEKE